MASLMPDDVFEECGVYPTVGLVESPRQVGLEGDVNIDLLPPDYDVLDPSLYAINNTYYASTTQGCPNSCPWCGVGKIEPSFVPYVDIKPMIRAMRARYGDKSDLRLMDNNVLASPELPRIVDDLVQLGYGRNQYTESARPRQRVVDFNQGVDARHITPETIALLANVNVRPLRIAFDTASNAATYERAVRLAMAHGFDSFSNYMLFNFNDTPRDLYERLKVNNQLNDESLEASHRQVSGTIFSYPMRYAPLNEADGRQANRARDVQRPARTEGVDWKREPVWTRRFVRNVELMKGAAGGAISPTPGLARRTIGESFEEFVANLYMPEELLRNRNRHEKRVWEHEPEPKRKPGTGEVERFRTFVARLFEHQGGAEFRLFHESVSPNRVEAVRKGP